MELTILKQTDQELVDLITQTTVDLQHFGTFNFRFDRGGHARIELQLDTDNPRGAFR